MSIIPIVRAYVETWEKVQTVVKYRNYRDKRQTKNSKKKPKQQYENMVLIGGFLRDVKSVCI